MPLKSELAKFAIRGSVTESAANTFTEAMVNTNLSPEGNLIFIATGLWTHTDAILDGNSEGVEMQLCYAPQSAIIYPNDGDWIFGRKIRVTVATQGAHSWERLVYQNINMFPIAQEALYWGTAGDSLAAATTARFKLEGFLMKVATTEYFRISRVR